MEENKKEEAKYSPPPDDRPLRIAECHIINHNDAIIYFDVHSQIMFAPDKPTLDIADFARSKESITIADIKEIFYPKHGKDTTDEIVEELLKFRLLLPADFEVPEPKWENKSKKLPERIAPRFVSLNITHKCNLACVYCYGDGGSYGTPNESMTFETAKAVVDWQVERIKEAGYKDFEITFFGGEPLANFDLIPQVVEYANKKAEENSLQVGFGMTTNGTLMTPEIAQKMAELGVGAMFSVDGPPQVQNSLRPLAGGGCSYDLAIQGMRNYAKAAKRRPTARATFLDYDLVYLSEELYKEGFGNVYLSPATGSLGQHFLTAGGVEKLIGAYEKLYDYYSEKIVQLAKKCEEKEEELVLPRNNVFIKTLQTLFYRQVQPWPCGAGRSYIGVSPKGVAYLCHRFVGNGSYSFGNIVDGTFQETWYKTILEKSGLRDDNCKKCWIRMSCAGNCFQHNLVQTDNIFKPHPHECETIKALTELAIKFYHKFHISYPEILKKICEIKEPVEYQTGVSENGN